jgi:hypothetical protein
MSVIKGRVYSYQPAGWERFDPKNAPKIPRGMLVRVMKKSPYGCPKQGTMGHYFIETTDTGKFIGLVSTASLAPPTDPDGGWSDPADAIDYGNFLANRKG